VQTFLESITYRNKHNSKPKVSFLSAMFRVKMQQKSTVIYDIPFYITVKPHMLNIS